MGKNNCKFNGKALYCPKGAAKEYSKWAVNFFTGCSHDCQYCYLKRGVLAHVWGTKPQLKKCFKDELHAMQCARIEIQENADAIIRDGGLLFSFSTDPCLPETWNMTRHIAYYCLSGGIPVVILTKATDWLYTDEAQKLLALGAKTGLLMVGFTLTGCDDMESNAPDNKTRARAMWDVKTAGVKTFASIEPIINFSSSFKMIEQTAECCDYYKIGLRSGVKKDYYDSTECAYFIGKVTGLCEKTGFKVYWKESIHKFVREHDKENENFEQALSVSKNFVGSDYNIFNDK